MSGQNQVNATVRGDEAENELPAGGGAAGPPEGPVAEAAPAGRGGERPPTVHPARNCEADGLSALAVADFEQSGRIRSETRQLLQKYLLGLLGYMGSFAFFITKDIDDKAIYVGAAFMSFAVYLILLKCVNLYAEQIQIATHHIRNQASHRARLGAGIVGLQGINLFSRQRSISGVASFFIPHWTTRTEFSMVYAMLGAAFLPVLQSWYFFRGIKNGTFFFIVELAVALMFMSKHLLDIFSYLVASRVTTPDNPVPTMRKTHLVEMPRKQNVEDSFSRNRRLLAATTLVFGILLTLFFGDWKIDGDGFDAMLLKLLTNLAPYLLVIWYIRVVNKHLFDDHTYRKSGIGLHGAYLTMMSFVGIGYFLTLAPLFDQLPNSYYQTRGIWTFCAILLGGVILIQVLLSNQKSGPDASCRPWRKSGPLFSLLYILICSSVYFILQQEEVISKATSVLNSGFKSLDAVGINRANAKSIAIGAVLFGVVASFSQFAFKVRKLRRAPSDPLPGKPWGRTLWVVLGITMLVYLLEQWDNLDLDQLFDKDPYLWMNLFHLLWVLPPLIAWLIVRKVISKYMARDSAAAVPNGTKEGLALMVGLSVGTIIYNYTTELFYGIDVGLLGFALWAACTADCRTGGKRSWYPSVALLLLCFMVVGAFNRLQFGHSNNAGTELQAIIMGYGEINSYLWAFPSGRKFPWAAVFLAVNIVIFGAAFLSVLIKFLISAARLFEYKSLEGVVNQAQRPTMTWSGVEWRVERPKKNVFRYLQTLLVLALLFLACPYWKTPMLVLVGLSVMLLYLTISDLFFERELLFCGQWLTEFSGMHLLADGFSEDDGKIGMMRKYLEAHGIDSVKLDCFIERYVRRRRKGDGEQGLKDARAVIRRLIDNSFYATLRQRMNAIFYIDHSTSPVPARNEPKVPFNGFKNGVNKDRHILARSIRRINRSSLMTPVRFVFLKPWSKELLAIYDNLGQPYKVWSNRASFLTKTPIHPSVITRERRRTYRVLLSSLTQAEQRMLAGVAKSMHQSVVEAEDLLHEWKHFYKEEGKSISVESALVGPSGQHYDLMYRNEVLERQIEELEKKHGLHASVPPHAVLLSCKKDIRENGGESVKDLIRSYEEIDVVFMGNCGGKHYDVLGIPYIHKKSKSFCFSDLFSIRKHLAFLVTHYHPAMLLRIKPDMIIMCGSSYFNINLAKLCRKINPRIRLAYFSPPHAEISTHANDQRVLDILKYSDVVVASTRLQQKYYEKQLVDASSESGASGILLNYKALLGKINFYGHPLPKWFYDGLKPLSMERPGDTPDARDTREMLVDLFNECSCREQGALTIYAGGNEMNWEKAFRVMLRAMRQKGALFKNQRVILLVPDLNAYERFRSYARDYLEQECGIANPVNEPIDFENFAVVILRRFYNDTQEQMKDINKLSPRGTTGPVTMEVVEEALDPVLVSRLFGKIYELDMGVVIRMTSGLIGFPDALMGVMSLFVPTISLLPQKWDRVLIDSITNARIRIFKEPVEDGLEHDLRPKAENITRVRPVSDEGIPLYVEKTPTQVISNFFHQIAERDMADLSDLRMDCLLFDKKTEENLWQELLERAVAMVSDASRRIAYRDLSYEVIQESLLAYADVGGSVIPFYEATAESCLRCLFKRQTLYPHQRD